MKKIIVLLLSLMLIFITGCGKNSDQIIDEKNPGQTENDVTGDTSTPDQDSSNPEQDSSNPEDNQPEDDQPEHDHDYNAVVTSPTCSSEGYTTYTCNCGDSYVSDRVDPTNHIYNSAVTAPTCTEDGYTTHTCSACGDTYTDNNTSATGHTEQTLSAVESTCSKTGLTEGKKCSVCGEVTVEQQVVATKSHSYSSNVTAPTCTEDGYTTHTCSACGDTYTDNNTSATGHTEQMLSAVESTCSKTGLTEGKKCSVCGEVTVEQQVVATKPHSYSSNVTAPTCTEDGYTTHTCSACGDRYTDNNTSATGHTEQTLSAVESTCSKTGLTEGKKCSVCGEVTVEQQVVATKPHSYSSNVTAPTCTEDGYTTHTCSACGDTYTDNNTSATGHTEQTLSAVESTCSKTGLTEGKKCSVCGEVTVEQQVVATKPHSYSSNVTAPTCTEDGYTTHTCSACGDTYTDNRTSAFGHTPGSAATCTDDQICTVCSVTITVALGHSWVDATTEAPKTCTVCGTTEGEKLPAETTTLPTLYVNYIDVGQGDSILIKVGDCDILIDAGTASYGSTVSSYLMGKGVDDIELMINTHPDSDHCGGLTQVLTDFVVEQVWISKNTSKTTAAYTNFISAIGREGLTAKQPSKGTVYTYEYLTITVLYSEIGSDSNNSSIVVMLEYGSFKFLFTGDIGSEVEGQLVSSNVDLSCDVLKVGHHGSAGSSTSSFLNATGAEYGVICVGDNTYGHPTSTALNNLSKAGISVYRTDLNGNVVFSTNGVTLYLPGGGSDTSGSGSGTTGGSGSSGDSGSSGETGGSIQYFIGNTETKVFHLPTCSNLPDASKQNLMYNYSWIVNIAGYSPCGRCLKNYSGSDSGGTVSYIANTESKVYHLSTCSYLPSASKQQVIYSTSGYTPCGHCINSGSTTKYIANTETKVYHLSTCSYLPASSKQQVIYSTTGYTPCGHCINK